MTPATLARGQSADLHPPFRIGKTPFCYHKGCRSHHCRWRMLWLHRRAVAWFRDGPLRRHQDPRPPLLHSPHYRTTQRHSWTLARHRHRLPPIPPLSTPRLLSRRRRSRFTRSHHLSFSLCKPHPQIPPKQPPPIASTYSHIPPSSPSEASSPSAVSLASFVTSLPDHKAARITLLSWLASNAFVGAQLSYLLRPFFGSPAPRNRISETRSLQRHLLRSRLASPQPLLACWKSRSSFSL